MNSYLKAMKFFLVPTVLTYFILAFVTLSFTKPLTWFMGFDTASLLLRGILLCVEIICYLVLVRFYDYNNNRSNKISFTEWLNK